MITDDVFTGSFLVELPGNFRVYGSELYRLRNGANEIEITTPEGKDITVSDLDYEAYAYYYDIWEKWHYLKMTPHGGQGWLDEPKWIITTLIMFDKLYKELELFEIKKARKK